MHGGLASLPRLSPCCPQLMPAPGGAIRLCPHPAPRAGGRRREAGPLCVRSQAVRPTEAELEPGVGVGSRGRGQLWGMGSAGCGMVGPARPLHGGSRPTGLEGLPLPGICERVPGQCAGGCLGPDHVLRGGSCSVTHDHSTSTSRPQPSVCKVEYLTGLEILRRGRALPSPSVGL